MISPEARISLQSLPERYAYPMLRRMLSSLALLAAACDAGATAPPAPPTTTPPEPAVVRDAPTQPPQTVPWSATPATYAWARETWRIQGERWLHRFAGVRREGAGWAVDPKWPHSPRNVGPKAYSTQYTTAAAVSLASTCGDVELADDLAGFFLAYAERFTTLGAMRAGSAGTGDITMIRERGPAHRRTFPWVQYRDNRPYIRECDLCMAQALYPAARLVRYVAELPASQRTETLTKFANLWGPLLLRDHLLRFLYELYRPLCGEKINQVQLWQTERDDSSCRLLFTDREMWLVATAAELLGASEADKGVLAMRPQERDSLLEAIDAGVAVVRTRIRRRPEVGKTPETTSWFEGDYTDRDEWAYAGYAGADFPQPVQQVGAPAAGWDVGHAHRIPIFLRALWDNRGVTGVDFPNERDLRLASGQLVHRVFYGDPKFPLLRNFFDGSDGWFRVGYHSVEFGYPPARDCDAAVKTRPCLNSISWQGWGAIAFAETEARRTPRRGAVGRHSRRPGDGGLSRPLFPLRQPSVSLRRPLDPWRPVHRAVVDRER